MDWWGKIRHNLHFGGVKAIAGAESIGEVSYQDLLLRRFSRVMARPADWAGRVFQKLAVRVGSGQDVFEISRSDRIGSGRFQMSRVGSGRVGSSWPDPTRPDPREVIRPLKSDEHFLSSLRGTMYSTP